MRTTVPPDPTPSTPGTRGSGDLIADIDAVIWEADARTLRFTFVSEGATAMLGVTPERWMADPSYWSDHLHDEDRERVVAQFVRAATAGWAFDTEYRLVTEDGRTVWVRDVGHVVKDAEGHPTVVRGFMTEVTRQKGLEDERRESEDRFRRVVERLPAIVYVEAVQDDVAAPGAMVYVSPQIEPVLGYPAQEWMGDPGFWAERVHPDDRERMRLDRTPVAGQTVSADYRMMAKDDRVVFVHDEAIVVTDDDGAPVYRQGILQDVTQQRESEVRAQESEARYRVLVEQLPAIVYSESVTGDTMEVVYVNARTQELLGIDPAEWLADPGTWWTGRIHADDRGAVEAEDARVQITGEPFHAEYRMVAVDGRTVWFRDEAVLIRDDSGAPRYWQGLMTDITALKETEAQLAEAEARYRALVEQTPTITYIDAIEGPPYTLYISPQTTAILGYTPQDWYQEADLFPKIVHPDDADRARHADESVGIHDAAYRVIAKDGHVVWLHDQARLITDDQGSPKYWQGVLVDITEARRAEELERDLAVERETAHRLRTLDDMKNTFLQAVSHDLRTPLAAILGLAVTMGRTDLEVNPGEVRDMARRIAQNARRLDRLVTDLLDLDRLTRGIVEPVFRPTDVGTLVRDLVESSDVPASRNLSTKIASVVIPVDPPKVERIVENLLGNALKHTPAQARIWVRVKPWEDGALIIVEDDGPGVPPELRERIFEPFQQAGTWSPHAPGVGVGLALVSRFAELHDGVAWVEPRPGGGASFRVFLPGRPAVVPPEASDAADQRAGTDASSSEASQA
jgi:PAS domain S-box-containing protein